MRRILGFATLILALFSTGATVVTQGSGPLDLQAALDSAEPGSRIQVPAGLYPGSLVIDKPLHLVGSTGPAGQRVVIDGEGTGTVLTIRASGTVVENLVIRNSGNVIDQEDGGIVVDTAEDVQILGNRLENVLYGIRGIQANRLIIRDNYITGKALDIARRGDGIRLWQSEDCLVEANTLERVRDAIFWFSDGTSVRDNLFRANRYGVHMMYTDGMLVEGNALQNNSVGAYLMYSINVRVQANTFEGNRGPSGYGLALKDMDAVTVLDNYFVDNRVGLFFDNTPSRVDLEQRIRRNVLAYNDIGVLMMPAVERNNLAQNSFVDNLEQVGIKGGGSRNGDQLGGNSWDANYWSDYAGYDVEGGNAGDGVGDLPYHAQSLFENIADRHPALKLFHFSPVEQAIDLAAQAFPIIKPKPKLTDAAPLMQPILPGVPPTIEPMPNRIGWLALGLLMGASAIVVAGSPSLATQPFSILRSAIRTNRGAKSPRLPSGSIPSEPVLQTERTRGRRNHKPSAARQTHPTHVEDQPMLSVQNLTKRYPQPGRPWWSDATVTAVDDLTFHLEGGRALALWGANGAGKTTVLKCVLGLLACEGTLRLKGCDLRRQGRTARRYLGYVPQELAFHRDLDVLESCRLYARLKRIPDERIPAVLDQVGLVDQGRKSVGALSGGMKQRLALALALLADPPLLLLDEPTSNLDATARNEFIQLLVQLRQSGRSLLFTSHHLADVEHLADQVLILEDGQAAALGTPTALMARLAPMQDRAPRHIKVVIPAEQRAAAEQTLADAGYRTSANGHGLWVEVTPDRKAAPLGLLYNADIRVVDVDL